MNNSASSLYRKIFTLFLPPNLLSLSCHKSELICLQILQLYYLLNHLSKGCYNNQLTAETNTSPPSQPRSGSESLRENPREFRFFPPAAEPFSSVALTQFPTTKGCPKVTHSLSVWSPGLKRRSENSPLPVPRSPIESPSPLRQHAC